MKMPSKKSLFIVFGAAAAVSAGIYAIKRHFREDGLYVTRETLAEINRSNEKGHYSDRDPMYQDAENTL